MKDTRGAPEFLELVERVNAGQFVFRNGEPGDAMYIIQEGQVEIVAQVGGSEKRLALLEEGDFFGEMAILEELPRTASARALTPCSLLRIDRHTFDQLIRQDPEIAVRMLRKLCHRLRTVQHLAFEAPAPEVDTVVAPSEEAAILLHRPSGVRFPLSSERENTVGRRDPVTGLSPTVDLGALDAQKSTSRRHAVVFYRDQNWYLREEVGVRNGTFINSTRLTPGQTLPIAFGDVLRFGAVELEFHKN